jgi:hypothetical protein
MKEDVRLSIGVEVSGVKPEIDIGERKDREGSGLAERAKNGR